MAEGLLRFWAAARQAAGGRAEEPWRGETLAEVLEAARAAHPGATFAAVLSRSSFLVSGAPVGRRDPATVRLADGDVVEVLPPFAGG